MFNRAIFSKTCRDSSLLLCAAVIGVIAFVVLFVWGMINLGDELMVFLSKFGFLRKMMEIAFGINTAGEISASVLFAVSFAHAMVLIQSWAVVIAISSRTTVGEIERGTADLLLTLPVTRSEVYFSAACVWMLAAVMLGFCPMIGVWIGTLLFSMKEPVDVGLYWKPAFNLIALLVAVGGVASLSSSLCRSRGQAIGVVVGLGLASMMLNFLEPFLPQLERIRWLGLLNYYRPVDVVRTDQWPVASIVVLVALGTVTWLIGLAVFHRKDIPTA